VFKNNVTKKYITKVKKATNWIVVCGPPLRQL